MFPSNFLKVHRYISHIDFLSSSHSPRPTPVLQLKVTVSPVAGPFSFLSPQHVWATLRDGESWGLHSMSPHCRYTAIYSGGAVVIHTRKDRRLASPMTFSLKQIYTPPKEDGKYFNGWFNGCCKVTLNSGRRGYWLAASLVYCTGTAPLSPSVVGPWGAQVPQLTQLVGSRYPCFFRHSGDSNTW